MSMIKKGDKYNKLTAIDFSRKIRGQRYWIFQCDCGNKKRIRVADVKSGNTKSCGCIFRKGNCLKHGMFGTPTYNSWASMKARCLNENYQKYKNYGGRGIKICLRWMKFENFFEDMGERPKNKTLDRINNNGNYTPENCRYATAEQQNNNRRNNLTN